MQNGSSALSGVLSASAAVCIEQRIEGRAAQSASRGRTLLAEM